jgi:hypothetical protein
MVKIAFYKGNSNTAWNNFWANAVRWWTNGPYSHAEVITKTDDAGRYYCYSSTIKEHGVRGEWRVLPEAEWDFVDVDYDPDRVISWFEERIKQGFGYDLAGLLGFVFRRDDYSKDKYFCSEAVAASIGIREAWRYDPNALRPIIDLISTYHKD